MAKEHTVQKLLTIIAVFAFVFSLSLIMNVHVYAAGQGKITFTMKSGDKAVGGGELTVYHAVKKADGSYDYEAVTVVNIDANGYAEAADLDDGLYYVVQTKAADGYSKINPFYVSIPYNGSHEVDAAPKMGQIVPDNPSEPDNPDTPDTPVQPQPDTPVSPTDPENPDIPKTPDTPETPKTPDTPEIPESPKTPENPVVPKTPDVPETPEGHITTVIKDMLPQTGQNWWIVWVSGGAGLVLIAIGLLMCLRKKSR